MPWKMAPESPKAAPETKAVTNLGKRTSQRTIDTDSGTSDAASPMEGILDKSTWRISLKGMERYPRERERNMTKRTPPAKAIAMTKGFILRGVSARRSKVKGWVRVFTVKGRASEAITFL
jgi:hypothetical protein